MTLDESSRLAHGDRHYTLTSLRFSSGLEGCPAGDLFLYFVGRVSNRPFGTRMGMIAAALYAPFSRGAVTLQSPVPDVPPRISQRLLSDPRDAQQLARFAQQSQLRQTVEQLAQRLLQSASGGNLACIAAARQRHVQLRPDGARGSSLHFRRGRSRRDRGARLDGPDAHGRRS